MTTYTEDEFGTRVLKDLGLLGSDETPTAEDLEWAKETAGAEIAMLSSIGLPIWNGSELSIPQEYLTILSRRVGLAVAPSYGLTDPASAQMAMREAERYMTIMASPNGPSPTTMRTDDALRRGSRFDFATGR